MQIVLVIANFKPVDISCSLPAHNECAIWLRLPVIFLAVILQSAMISRVYLLSGIADLPLVMLAAWALQEEV